MQRQESDWDYGFELWERDGKYAYVPESVFGFLADMCDDCERSPEQEPTAIPDADQNDRVRLELWMGFDVSKCPHFDRYELAVFVRDHCSPFQHLIYRVWEGEADTGRSLPGLFLAELLCEGKDAKAKRKWYNRWKQESHRLRKKSGKFLDLPITIKGVERKMGNYSSGPAE